MLNILLNRYYINNVSRSAVSAESRERVQSLLAGHSIGMTAASGAGTSTRGLEPHSLLQGELRHIWARHLAKEDEQKHCSGPFCNQN